MIDLQPAAERLGQVVAAVRDDQLGSPTPCVEASLGDLIDHIGTLAVAFTGVARKDQAGPGAGGPPPPPSAANLEEGWRQRIVDDLRRLAAAWAEPGSWDGMTTAGGIDMPAPVAGLVALDELVVHGWDAAVSSGQPYRVPDEEVEAASSFAASVEGPRDGTLFGPAVEVPHDAPPLDRLLGLTGRDPRWAVR
jgi:uncharacterized protein (TIGR03086 family)